jgi:hypothetical protein
MSKVQIPLGANNSLGPLPDLCGWGALHRFEVYLVGVGTRSGFALKGSSLSKKKKTI